MPLDFTNAPDQAEERKYGPVPAGSIVIVRMDLLSPYTAAPFDPDVSISKGGLFQLPCRFTVLEGEYAKVHFNQNITLPEGFQNISLTDGQRKACLIGAAQFKAICQAGRKNNMRMNSWREFGGVIFPVKVKIRNLPNEYEGRLYWNNEISRVITPDMPDFQKLRDMPKGARELINAEGAVTGKGAASDNGNGFQGAGADFGGQAEVSFEMDDIPF